MRTNKKILVVEDDFWLRDQLIRELEKVGYSVAGTDNALEAIDLIDEFAPNVLILDIFLPGPNGVVLLHELQSHSDLSKIPVIVCTSSSFSGNLISYLTSYGVVGVLDKTLMHPNDLTVAVRKALL